MVIFREIFINNENKIKQGSAMFIDTTQVTHTRRHRTKNRGGNWGGNREEGHVIS
jgi:hypothetical protein